MADINVFNKQTMNVYLIKENPETYKEAIDFINANFQKKAIHSELESLIGNETWMTYLPRSSTLRSKCICKAKLRTNETIDN